MNVMSTQCLTNVTVCDLDSKYSGGGSPNFTAHQSVEVGKCVASISKMSDILIEMSGKSVKCVTKDEGVLGVRMSELNE